MLWIFTVHEVIGEKTCILCLWLNLGERGNSHQLAWKSCCKGVRSSIISPYNMGSTPNVKGYSVSSWPVLSTATMETASLTVISIQLSWSGATAGSWLPRNARYPKSSEITFHNILVSQPWPAARLGSISKFAVKDVLRDTSVILSVNVTDPP